MRTYIFESSGYYGPQIIGKAQGIFVASSEDKSRATDVHQRDRSHVALIGGIGMYDGANGYATVKAVNNAVIVTQRIIKQGMMLSHVTLSN
ncbi:hypothetical protein ACFX1Q_001985 [Malus domestica]